MPEKPFRILSIDGGGIRGIIPAVGLTMIERQLQLEGKQARICDYFDLICGTSTGAILAIALALGIPAKELLKLYLKNADRIFPSKKNITMFWKAIRNKEIYNRDQLSGLIEDVYSNATGEHPTRIGHCKTRICIPTYDVGKGEMHVFKTSHHAEFVRDYQIPAHHIALASAAAPIYFDSYSFEYGLHGSEETNAYKYNVDGGVIANNPTLIGYTEAVMTLKQKPENLRILSLGTGDAIYKDERKNLRMGGSYWIKNKNAVFAFYSLFSSAQSLYIDNTMKFLQRGAGSGSDPVFMYERIQHPFSIADNIEMNTSDPTKLKSLVSIGKNLYKDKIDGIISDFCFAPKGDFIPSHQLHN